MEDIFILILNSLSSTSIVVLMSIGLFIVFGMMGVINLAHGEFFMLGAYIVAIIGGKFGNTWYGIIAAPVIVGFFGLLIEKAIIRPLYIRPLETLLATWGISIVIKQTVRLLFGAGYQFVKHPMPGMVTILGVSYPILRLFIIGVATAVFVSIYLLMFRTDLGLRIRAVLTDRNMAEAVGIDTVRTGQTVFVLGSAMAGLAGAVMSPLVPVNPEMGLEYANKAFNVVIVGGLSKLLGIIGGGVIIGGGESIMSFFMRPLVAQVMILVITIIVIRFKPQGLF